MTMLPPDVLRQPSCDANLVFQPGIPLYQLVQNAGDIVLTFPKAYHAGFNHGFNVAESVNFTPIDWLPYAWQSQSRYQSFRRPPVFCTARLIYSAATELIEVERLQKERQRRVRRLRGEPSPAPEPIPEPEPAVVAPLLGDAAASGSSSSSSSRIIVAGKGDTRPSAVPGSSETSRLPASDGPVEPGSAALVVDGDDGAAEGPVEPVSAALVSDGDGAAADVEMSCPAKKDPGQVAVEDERPKKKKHWKTIQKEQRERAKRLEEDKLTQEVVEASRRTGEEEMNNPEAVAMTKRDRETRERTRARRAAEFVKKSVAGAAAEWGVVGGKVVPLPDLEDNDRQQPWPKHRDHTAAWLFPSLSYLAKEEKWARLAALRKGVRYSRLWEGDEAPGYTPARHINVQKIIPRGKKAKKKITLPSSMKGRDGSGLTKCAICQVAVFLSCVSCDCCPGRQACLEHAAELCDCPINQRLLQFRHTLAELDDLVTAVKAMLPPPPPVRDNQVDENKGQEVNQEGGKGTPGISPDSTPRKSKYGDDHVDKDAQSTPVQNEEGDGAGDGEREDELTDQQGEYMLEGAEASANTNAPAVDGISEQQARIQAELDREERERDTRRLELQRELESVDKAVKNAIVAAAAAAAGAAAAAHIFATGAAAAASYAPGRRPRRQTVAASNAAAAVQAYSLAVAGAGNKRSSPPRLPRSDPTRVPASVNLSAATAEPTAGAAVLAPDSSLGEAPAPKMPRPSLPMLSPDLDKTTNVVDQDQLRVTQPLSAERSCSAMETLEAIARGKVDASANAEAEAAAAAGGAAAIASAQDPGAPPALSEAILTLRRKSKSNTLRLRAASPDPHQRHLPVSAFRPFAEVAEELQREQEKVRPRPAQLDEAAMEEALQGLYDEVAREEAARIRRLKGGSTGNKKKKKKMTDKERRDKESRARAEERKRIAAELAAEEVARAAQDPFNECETPAEDRSHQVVAAQALHDEMLDPVSDLEHEGEREHAVNAARWCRDTQKRLRANKLDNKQALPRSGGSPEDETCSLEMVHLQECIPEGQAYLWGGRGTESARDLTTQLTQMEGDFDALCRGLCTFAASMRRATRGKKKQLPGLADGGGWLVRAALSPVRLTRNAHPTAHKALRWISYAVERGWEFEARARELVLLKSNAGGAEGLTEVLRLGQAIPLQLPSLAPLLCLASRFSWALMADGPRASAQAIEARLRHVQEEQHQAILDGRLYYGAELQLIGRLTASSALVQLASIRLRSKRPAAASAPRSRPMPASALKYVQDDAGDEDDLPPLLDVRPNKRKRGDTPRDSDVNASAGRSSRRSTMPTPAEAAAVQAQAPASIDQVPSQLEGAQARKDRLGFPPLRVIRVSAKKIIMMRRRVGRGRPKLGETNKALLDLLHSKDASGSDAQVRSGKRVKRERAFGESDDEEHARLSNDKEHDGSEAQDMMAMEHAGLSNDEEHDGFEAQDMMTVEEQEEEQEDKDEAEVEHGAEQGGGEHDEEENEDEENVVDDEENEDDEEEEVEIGEEEQDSEDYMEEDEEENRRVHDEIEKWAEKMSLVRMSRGPRGRRAWLERASYMMASSRKCSLAAMRALWSYGNDLGFTTSHSQQNEVATSSSTPSEDGMPPARCTRALRVLHGSELSNMGPDELFHELTELVVCGTHVANHLRRVLFRPRSSTLEAMRAWLKCPAVKRLELVPTAAAMHAVALTEAWGDKVQGLLFGEVFSDTLQSAAKKALLEYEALYLDAPRLRQQLGKLVDRWAEGPRM